MLEQGIFIFNDLPESLVQVDDSRFVAEVI
jgi:hypothetical protein